MTVYLAYYHAGFQDDAPDLLAVCDTRKIAESFIVTHKRTRNRDYEYKNKAK